MGTNGTVTLLAAKDCKSDSTPSTQFVLENGKIFEGDTLNRVWSEPKPLRSHWK
jgi:hypothetical protein